MESLEQSRLQLSIRFLSYLYQKQALVKSSEISEDFSLSPRAVRRLVSELRELGYDIESVSGPYGGYRLNKSNLILPVRLTDNEKRHWNNIVTSIAASDLSDKDEALNLLNTIALQSQLEYSESYDIYITKTLTYKTKRKIDHVRATLKNAMNLKQRVEIKYLNSEWREFRPHQFQLFNNIIYIKGYYNQDSNTFRTLRLSRFDDIRIIDKKYTFNENFDRDNDHSAFSKQIFKSYLVKLIVYEGAHDILDYEYGAQQSVSEHPKGKLLTFVLEGDQLIKDLVVSLGKDVELLEPQFIRSAIKQDFEILSLRYKEDNL